MKKGFNLTTITLAALVICFGYVNGQAIDSTKNVNGIFRTTEDFIHGNIALKHVSDHHHYIEEKLGVEFLLVRNGERVKFNSREINGYYKDGYKYRTFCQKGILKDCGFYKVVDDSALIVYTRKSHNQKTNGRIWYYYSIAQERPIKRLNTRNIRKDFYQRTEFVDLAIFSLKNKTFMQIADDQLMINKLYLSSGD